MKKLRCKILGGDWFLDQLRGLTVTVTEVDLRCTPTGGGYGCTVEVDGEMTAEQKRLLDKVGKICSVYSECLEPLDTSMVPETHCGNLMLKRVWVFAEARNDAWLRGKPRDLAKYEEDTGHPWTDERIFDVGQRRMDGMSDINLTDDRYLAALRRIRANIAARSPFTSDDDDTIGNKHTECSWGLCSHRKEDWPCMEDHLWPNQFREQGRVAPLYRKKHQLCPFDRRMTAGTVDDLAMSQGCIYTCRIFRPKKDPKMTRELALELYDQAIERILKYKHVSEASDGNVTPEPPCLWCGDTGMAWDREMKVACSHCSALERAIRRARRANNKSHRCDDQREEHTCGGSSSP